VNFTILFDIFIWWRKAMREVLSCHLHDYVEIACLYGFEVSLQLSNQKTVQGKAMTTKITLNKSEHLLVLVNGQTVEVDTADILTMKAVSQNPHFDLIEFR
jgi:Rho-binding antiterminator